MHGPGDHARLQAGVVDERVEVVVAAAIEPLDHVRGFKLTTVGYYQYLVASRDPAEQARDFTSCIGPLRDNEFAIGDSEEGSGSQTGRVQT